MAKEVKNEKILKAAEKVYKDVGLDRATVTDICNEADISRKTFYQRFKNLDELLSSLITRISEKIVSRVEDGDETIDSWAMLMHIFDIYEESAHNHPLLVSLYRNKFARWISWEEYNISEKLDRAVEKKIAEIIKKGVASGQFRDVDADGISKIFTLTLGIIYFVFGDFSLSGNIDVEEMKSGLKTLLHAGLVPAGAKFSIE